MIMNKIAGIILIALLALSSCNKTNKKVEVLARVGSSVLIHPHKLRIIVIIIE